MSLALERLRMTVENILFQIVTEKTHRALSSAGMSVYTLKSDDFCAKRKKKYSFFPLTKKCIL
jgi:hypothetical protein